jgi:hypothetical protein
MLLLLLLLVVPFDDGVRTGVATGGGVARREAPNGSNDVGDDVDVDVDVATPSMSRDEASSTINGAGSSSATDDCGDDARPLLSSVNGGDRVRVMGSVDDEDNGDGDAVGTGDVALLLPLG